MGGEHRLFLLLFYLPLTMEASQQLQQPQQPYWPQQPTQLPFPGVIPQVPSPQTGVPTQPSTIPRVCNDRKQCSYWTKNGFCNHSFYNEHYKTERCANACGLCSTNPNIGGRCADTIAQCSSYVSIGYCSIPGGKEACCATCSTSTQTPTTGQPGGIDIGSILGGLGGLIPGLGGGGSGGQQPQPQTGNPLGALGSILGGLTGGGGQGGGGNPLSALGNVLPQNPFAGGGGGGGGGSNPLNSITNGLGSIGNLANLAGMLG